MNRVSLERGRKDDIPGQPQLSQGAGEAQKGCCGGWLGRGPSTANGRRPEGVGPAPGHLPVPARARAGGSRGTSNRRLTALSLRRSWTAQWGSDTPRRRPPAPTLQPGFSLEAGGFPTWTGAGAVPGPDAPQAPAPTLPCAWCQGQGSCGLAAAKGLPISRAGELRAPVDPPSIHPSVWEGQTDPEALLKVGRLPDRASPQGCLGNPQGSPDLRLCGLGRLDWSWRASWRQ